jgi:NAD(P)-dependent dehydrogenase (short-subunit alcohol dehydrogenase family)
MVNTLENQTVVILGGSTGIGYGVAKNLLESSKANVVIASSTTKRVEEAISSLSAIEGAKGRISGHVTNLDVSESEAPIAQLFDKIGKFDHLIYTAADPLYFVPFDEVSKKAADKAFGIRYWSLLVAIRLALSHMPKSADSSITITSGTVVFRPLKGWCATFSGVGSAVEGLTRGLAVDLAPIRVNCVAPGAVPETDVWSGLSEEQMTQMVEDLKKKALTGRVGFVEDVAEAYAYLVKGRFTNGQTLILDGGEYLN